MPIAFLLCLGRWHCSALAMPAASHLPTAGPGHCLILKQPDSLQPSSYTWVNAKPEVKVSKPFWSFSLIPKPAGPY